MNILLLSSIYPLPGPENQGTKVCHFFAKEWNTMGNNVKAVHYQSTYPIFYYWIARLFQKKLAAKTGAIVYTKKETKISKYEKDGVSVMRIPLYKPMPHGRFSERRIKDSVKAIIANNEDAGFTPDVIVGHFLNPQLESISFLKQQYTSAKTCLVFHLPAEFDMADKLYGNNLASLFQYIDVFGFRNAPLMKSFETRYKTSKRCFVCYSGIPGSYITENNAHCYAGNVTKFLYVGGLIERKYPAQILDALHRVYPDGGYEMNYVGGGQEKTTIEKKIEQFNIADSVVLHGKIDRDKILTLYDQSECMIMISKGEAYGLVYLEAMARGCITVASENEGMDGVIVDGVNGFLCPAGDAEKLADIIKRINALSDEEKARISYNAIETAKSLTDQLAAKRYIEDVIG